MVKRLFLAGLLGAAATTAVIVDARQDAAAKETKLMARVERALDLLPDSVFDRVDPQDLLDDKVYIQLKKEGWSRDEIEKIMNVAVRDRRAARNRGSYYEYAKEWLPYQRLGDWTDEAIPADSSGGGSANTDDQISDGNSSRYEGGDTASNSYDVPLSAAEFYNKSWPEIDYTPDDRLAGRRNPGYWRPAKHKPSSGRVLWAAIHPEDPDKIMFIGDGAGMWRTDDGRNWRNITDNIPDRNWRYTSFHSAIPVDPDDWNHVFAFMNVSPKGGATSVWETKDGGQTWRRIQGATHGFFKRGYCFRDAEGKLKFIGAVREQWSAYPGRTHNRLLISEDTCKTWTNLKDQLTTDDGFDLRDDIPAGGGAKAAHGLWFQQMEFDPKDRNRIYIPTSRSILYFDDGAKSTLVDGKLKYNLKKMRIRVHGRTLDTPVRNEDTPYNFPVAANGVGHMVIDQENPNRMWYATGDRDNNNTALFFTENRGEDWITLFDRWQGIGRSASGDGIFGNEVAWVWLGGFAVNLRDNRYMYGCSQNSMWSETDWQNGEDVVVNRFHWGGAMTAMHDDGNYYLVSNARHQADNHFLLSHKSGRVFRGCDGGLLMIDPAINNHRWTNIGNNANEMCNYRVQCNEFGDQVMISNTQDIDIQTYRYGRWGLWHGYEGSNSCINPYANTGYWSGSGGLQGLDEGAYSGNSWASVITRADVVNNTFYLLNTTSPEGRRLSRWDDLGRGGEGLDAALGGVPSLYNWGLCRDKGRCTLYAMIGSRLRRSTDQGKTFEDVSFNGSPASFSGTLALDPDNSDIAYFGQRGRVVRVNLTDGTETVLPQEGLPNIDCHNLLFHEGTGDLYFCNGNDGIYYLRQGDSAWKFWLKGYNTNHGNSQVINYTTQEMIQCDYGRGVYVADLERPADRYFRNGFKLKEFSNVDGLKTIGIDTYMTIPLYYNYRWTVNGADAGHPYGRLTRRLQPGDRVQLKLTLRESPDVSTLSEVYTVRETAPAAAVERLAGKALYSDGQGRVDVGFTDYFLNDFTVDLWCKPQSDGCIVGNRQRDDHLGAKGWVLCIEGGTLKFKYSPRHRFHSPRYESGDTEDMWTLDCGRINPESWYHLAVTQTRNGQVKVYVNGNLAGQTDRRLPESSLNSSLPLSLFGDGIDRYPLRGSIDELKVWKRALEPAEIRAEMYSTNLAGTDDLVMHYDFDGERPADNRETFTGYTPLSRIRAVTTAVASTLPIGAKAAAVATATAADSTVMGSLLTVRTRRQQDINLGAYAYDTRRWKTADDNLLQRYYDVEPTAYMLHSFDAVDEAELADLTFKPFGQAYGKTIKYRLYWSESTSEQPFWNLVGELAYDAATGNLTMADAPLGRLVDKKLLVVAPKPALEATVQGLNTQGVYEVCSPDQSTLTVTVRTLQSLDEPLDSYEIVSDNGLLLPQGTLNFVQGVATVQMRVDMSRLPERDQTVTTTLRGRNDDMMIPLTVTVANRITRPDAGTCLTINGGSAQIGSRQTFLPIDNTRSVTVMGWVRVDDASWSSGGGNMQYFWFSSGWGFMARGGWTYFRAPGMSSNGTAAQLPVNASAVGRWAHLAWTLDDRTIKLYVNGHKTSEFAYNGGNFSTSSGLWLGAPTGGFSYFKGAFDQVAVWGRALPQDEIVRYMQNRVTLDSPNLVSYVTMEEVDGQGRMVDMVSGHTVACSGTADNRQQSTVYYDPADQTDGSQGVLTLNYPAGKSRPTVVSAFNGQSSDFLAADNTELVPLNREHYTVAFSAPGNVANTDQVNLTYTHPTVRAGEAVRMAIRPFGAVSQPYTRFVDAAAVTDGQASFVVPFSELSANAELMMFVPRTDELRAAAVTTTVDDTQLAVADGRVKLRDSDSALPVTMRLTAGQISQPVAVYVKESAYAVPDVETVDFSGSDVVRFNIRIDRSKLDPKALNPVTVSLPGIDGAETVFNVYLEPKVSLRLRNGRTDNSYVATSPIADLDIEARLEQGWLDGPVQLEFIGSMPSTTSVGAGTLLSNNPVRIAGLKHYSSFETEAIEGWNLVGNPYMANVNLTKSQNVSFDADRMTKFVYSYNQATGNYEAYDMTRYDARQVIKPFESYFVQTTADNASMTVTPVATEQAPTKRTQAAAVEETYVKLELLTDGRLADRAAIYWEGTADGYAVNEDAPKFWSVNPKANQLYLLATDDSSLPGNIGTTPLSISSVNMTYGYFPLGLKVASPGRLEIRLAECSHTLNGEELYIIDRQTDSWHRLFPGQPGVTIDVTNPAEINNRYYFYHDDPQLTGVGEVQAQASPYTVESGYGTIMVKGLKGDAQVSLYRPNGVQVCSQHTKDATFRLTVEPGFYIVRIHEQGRDYSVKTGVRQ